MCVSVWVCECAHFSCECVCLRGGKGINTYLTGVEDGGRGDVCVCVCDITPPHDMKMAKRSYSG